MRELESYRDIASDPDAFRLALGRPETPTIWLNTRRAPRADVEWLLAEEGIELEALSWGRDGFRARAAGRFGTSWLHCVALFRFQEAASSIPAQVLAPRAGDRVLDLCAAPGGKTAQLSGAVGVDGLVVANEPAIGRRRSLRNTIERFGLHNVVVTTVDGTKFPNVFGDFDRVLVDAPCSGEGTSRRALGASRPRVYRPVRSGLQRRLLERAVELCRPGGRIVYSTCTYDPVENEAVIDDVLRRFAGRLRVIEASVSGFRSASGVAAWGGRTYDARVEGCMRVWPEMNDTGGFFVALLEKLDARREPAVSGVLELESPALVDDDRRWRATILEHGIPQSRLAPFRLTRDSARSVYISARCAIHAGPPGLVETRGYRALRVLEPNSKMSTALALELGRVASRRVIELDLAQTRSLLAGDCFRFEASQLLATARGGFLIARHRGYPVGTVLIRHGSDEARGLWPKGWSSGAVGRDL